MPVYFKTIIPQHHGSTPKRTPQILAGTGVKYGRIGSGRTEVNVKVKVRVLAIALLTEARTAALYNLGSGS